LTPSAKTATFYRKQAEKQEVFVMSSRLTQLLAEMTPQEQTEVEAFAAFLIVRRQLQQPQLLTDDISVQELTELVAASGSFDWLNAEEEDVYSLADGEAVQWPSP
jgi:hypothetical protein